MPHPKNRLKLTGDTHLPDIGDLLERADADEPAVLEFDTEPRVYADGWTPSGAEALHQLVRRVDPRPDLLGPDANLLLMTLPAVREAMDVLRFRYQMLKELENDGTG